MEIKNIYIHAAFITIMLTSVQGPYYLATASHIVHQIWSFLYLLLLAIVVFQLLPWYKSVAKKKSTRAKQHLTVSTNGH